MFCFIYLHMFCTFRTYCTSSCHSNIHVLVHMCVYVRCACTHMRMYVYSKHTHVCVCVCMYEYIYACMKFSPPYCFFFQSMNTTFGTFLIVLQLQLLLLLLIPPPHDDDDDNLLSLCFFVQLRCTEYNLCEHGILPW
jgi:hypothetical protein